MNKHGEDVTITLIGITIDAKAESLSPNIGVNIRGQQVDTKMAEFIHTKEVHSEKEKPWFTWLNVSISIVLAALGF